MTTSPQKNETEENPIENPIENNIQTEENLGQNQEIDVIPSEQNAEIPIENATQPEEQKIEQKKENYTEINPEKEKLSAIQEAAANEEIKNSVMDSPKTELQKELEDIRKEKISPTVEPIPDENEQNMPKEEPIINEPPKVDDQNEINIESQASPATFPYDLNKVAKVF